MPTVTLMPLTTGFSPFRGCCHQWSGMGFVVLMLLLLLALLFVVGGLLALEAIMRDEVPPLPVRAASGGVVVLVAELALLCCWRDCLLLRHPSPMRDCSCWYLSLWSCFICEFKSKRFLILFGLTWRK